MKLSTIISAFLFVAVGLTGISTGFAAKPKRGRYRVELPLTVKDQDTKEAVQLPAKKGYSYEVKEQLTDVAVLRIFNSEGKALDGYYEITIEELHQLLNKKINSGLKATSGKAAPVQCATCQVVDPGSTASEVIPDRRPAFDRETPSPVPKLKR